MDKLSQMVMMGAAGRKTQQYVFVTTGNSAPGVFAYPWDDENGFGSKFANPSTALSGFVFEVKMHPLGNAVAFAIGNNAPRLVVYAWSKDGFGAKFSDPSVLPDNNRSMQSLAWSPSGDVLVGANGLTIEAYQFSEAGFGTKFSPVSVGVDGGAVRVNTSPVGNLLTVGTNTGSYLFQYAYTSSSFGARTVPNNVPGSAISAIAYNNEGNRILAASTNLPVVAAYTTAWTRFSNPSTLPQQQGRCCAFSPGDDYVAVGTSGASPNINVYDWDNTSGFGARFTLPGSPNLTGEKTGVTWSKTGGAILFTESFGSYLRALSWSSSGYGTQYANAAIHPSVTCRSIHIGEL